MFGLVNFVYAQVVSMKLLFFKSYDRRLMENVAVKILRKNDGQTMLLQQYSS